MIHDSDDQAEQSPGILKTESINSGKTHQKRLLIGAYGWRHDHWLDSFYPDDLPEDWQLGFYANEFPSVLVPAHYWQEEDCDPEQWLEDVDEQFRFYLECPGDGNDEQIKQQGKLLGSQLAGFFHRTAKRQQVEIDENSAVALIEFETKTMREWKSWLQAFSQSNDRGNLQAVFLSDTKLMVDQLREFKTLVELMGL